MIWLVTVGALAGAYVYGGLHALAVVSLLCVLEVSLSFDNAVVNAAVLRRMSPKWQRRFLTWGILIAVFGMRLIFPVLIVALATGLSFGSVGLMALNDAESYSRHLSDAHAGIAAFGGMFLLMVFLHFICDEAKDVHWIGWIERKLSAMGRMEAVEVGLAIAVLLIVQMGLPESSRVTVITAGLIGVMTYIGVKGLSGLWSDSAALVGKAGFAGFMYLEVLDASFSLDGVIGAFAISNDVLVIMIGLAIGALFVRHLTIQLVRRGTLEKYTYLEHGAHWGIGALGIIMLISLHVHVPELLTGLLGASLIGLSFLSSIRRREYANA